MLSLCDFCLPQGNRGRQSWKRRRNKVFLLHSVFILTTIFHSHDEVNDLYVLWSNSWKQSCNKIDSGNNSNSSNNSKSNNIGNICVICWIFFWSYTTFINTKRCFIFLFIHVLSYGHPLRWLSLPPSLLPSPPLPPLVGILTTLSPIVPFHASNTFNRSFFP